LRTCTTCGKKKNDVIEYSRPEDAQNSELIGIPIWPSLVCLDCIKKEHNIKEDEKLGALKILKEIDLQDYSKASLVLVDMDKLKKINDNHGYQKGDAIIGNIFSILKELKKKGHLVERTYKKGDEFLIMIFEKDKDEAFSMIDECRKKIEKETVEGITATIKGGIACYPTDTQTMDDLVKKSDQALRVAKSCGGNVIIKYGEEKNLITVNFTFEGIADIKKGSKVTIKMWRNFHPPHIVELEALEMLDLDNDTFYDSGNKGMTTTTKEITKDLTGVITEVQRMSKKTLFKMKINKDQLE
jgi:diguanylate cyclase (GGDEF)-like protein